ncbi:hypothetical protein MY1884_002320 [Beauveria asiatica]
MPAFPRLDEAHGMASLVSRNSAENTFERFAVEAWTLLSMALAFTALRMGFRISTLGIRNLWLDDYLVCIGMLFYVAETILAYSVGQVARGLANGGMTDQQRATLGSDDAEYRLRCLSSCALDAYNLDEPRPQRVNRFISPIDSDPSAVEVWFETIQENRVDRIIHFWRIRRGMRVAAEPHHHHSDDDWAQDPSDGPQTAGAWGVRESFVATVVTNLPIVFPWFKTLFKRHVAAIWPLRLSKSDDSAAGFRTIGGGDGHGGARVRRMPQSVNPLPTKLTVTGSAEQLVDNGIELQIGESLAPSERAVAVDDDKYNDDDNNNNTGGPPPSTRAATANARDTEAAASGSARAP